MAVPRLQRQNARVEFVDEGKIVREYGARYPDEFGGIYRDGAQLVVLFTRNLDRHLVRLRRRLPLPETLRVDQAARPYRDIERENDELTRRLLIDARHPGVTAVGITVSDGQFVVMVGIHPHNHATETAVRVAAAPIPSSCARCHRPGSSAR